MQPQIDIDAAILIDINLDNSFKSSTKLPKCALLTLESAVSLL